jgi:hypothetical protein
LLSHHADRTRGRKCHGTDAATLSPTTKAGNQTMTVQIGNISNSYIANDSYIGNDSWIGNGNTVYQNNNTEWSHETPAFSQNGLQIASGNGVNVFDFWH